ncbi:MAG: hypothetical protein HY902_17145, partial [Deltaproteobacteria bacterium]|nr:hypothetical protein [Deltaproteobacteria bacterium]
MQLKSLCILSILVSLIGACASNSSGGSGGSLPNVALDGANADSATNFGKDDSAAGNDTGTTAQPD